MSIRIELPDLADAIRARPAAAYVCTTSADGRPHLAHQAVTVRDSVLACSAGRTAQANVTDRPLVVLLWPGPEDDYSLIVDGEAVVDGDQLVITPTGAVLHRPAP